MAVLREFDIVRVVRLIEAHRPYDGTDGVRRPPMIGDLATVCHDYNPGDPSAPVAAEMVDGDGYTIWLADFRREEIELAEPN